MRTGAAVSNGLAAGEYITNCTRSGDFWFGGGFTVVDGENPRQPRTNTARKKRSGDVAPKLDGVRAFVTGRERWAIRTGAVPFVVTIADRRINPGAVRPRDLSRRGCADQVSQPAMGYDRFTVRVCQRFVVTTRALLLTLAALWPTTDSEGISVYDTPPSDRSPLSSVGRSLPELPVAR